MFFLRKKLSVFIGFICSSMLLSACGGSSDSSNSSNDVTESCVYVKDSQGNSKITHCNIFLGDNVIIKFPSDIEEIQSSYFGTFEKYKPENSQNSEKSENDYQLFKYKFDLDILNYRKLEFPITEQLSLLHKDGTKEKVDVLIENPNKLMSYQWHLYNIGKNYYGTKSAPKSGVDLNIFPVWSLVDSKGNNITGKGVNVAIYDVGYVAFDHPNLVSNEKKYNLPYVNQINTAELINSYDDDPFGIGDLHSTLVGGIIFGHDDKLGTISEAFDASAFSVHANITQSDSKNFSILKDADVVNASIGIGPLLEPKEKSKENFKNLVLSNKTVYVKAQGNDFARAYSSHEDFKVFFEKCEQFGVDCQYAQNDEPSRFPETVNVSAIDSLGYKSTYSSTGANVWVAGTSGEFGYREEKKNYSAAIVSTLTRFKYSDHILSDKVWQEYLYLNFDSRIVESDPLRQYSSDGMYSTHMNGTSAATPSISGIVALLKQVNKNFNVYQIRYLLASSVRNHVNSDIGLSYYKLTENKEKSSVSNLTAYVAEDSSESIITDLGWQKNAAGIYFSNWYGFGLPDAKKAVDLALKCESDSGCSKREQDPIELSSIRGDGNCTQKDDNDSLLFTYECAFGKLHQVVNSELLTEVYDKSLEIENLSIDINGLSYTNEVGKDGYKYKDYCVIKKNETEFISKFKESYMLTQTQIELDSPNATESFTDKSILKPYWAFVNIANDDDGVKSQDEQELFINTNAFYQEQLPVNGEWKVTIKSICPVDIDKFKEDMRIVMKGY